MYFDAVFRRLTDLGTWPNAVMNLTTEIGFICSDL